MQTTALPDIMMEDLKLGLACDSLTASKLFMPQHQGPEEKVCSRFPCRAKQLFRKAYPAEILTSIILLQRFLTAQKSVSNYYCVGNQTHFKGQLKMQQPLNML